MSAHGLSSLLRSDEGDRLTTPAEQFSPAPPRMRELRPAFHDDRAQGRRTAPRAPAGRRMSEHPTAEQVEALRAQGWTIVTTLNGLLATHPGGPVVPWREALGLDAAEQDAAA